MDNQVFGDEKNKPVADEQELKVEDKESDSSESESEVDNSGSDDEEVVEDSEPESEESDTDTTDYEPESDDEKPELAEDEPEYKNDEPEAKDDGPVPAKEEPVPSKTELEPAKEELVTAENEPEPAKKEQVPVKDKDEGPKSDSEMEDEDEWYEEDKSNFPFWKLPLLARSLVTRLMTPYEVIELTMVSIPFKKFMMAFKLPRAELTFKFRESYSVCRHSDHLRNNNFGIDLDFPKRRSISLVLPFPKKIFFGPWRNVNGKPMIIEKFHGHFVFGGDRKMKKKMRYMERMARHLVDVCHVTKYSLEHDGKVKKLKLFDSFVWNFVEKFDEIKIGSTMMSCDMTHDQVRFLLNTVKCDKMVLNGHVNGKVKDLQIKSKSLKVNHHGGWLSLDSIIESECEEISGQIRGAKPTKTAKLVKKWQNGEKLTNLKALGLTLGLMDTDQSPALEIIDQFDGVKELSQAEKQILKNGELKKRFPQGKVRKIRRITDGKIAVFCVNEDYVWMRVLKSGEPLKDF